MTKTFMPSIKITKTTILAFCVVILIIALILVLCCVANFISLEKRIKAQLQPANQKSHLTVSVDRGYTPKFSSEKELAFDIAQMYHYHDLTHYGRQSEIRGDIKAEIYNDNDTDRIAPSVLVFTAMSGNEGNGTERKLMFVICRSTKTKFEADKDLDLAQENGTHKGIRSIYMSLRHKTMNAIIDNNTDEIKGIVLFGHSLGGALVDLFSLQLMTNEELWNKCIAISSGGPRLFTPSLCDAWSNLPGLSRYMKIINAADMVPSMPNTVTAIDGVFGTGKKYCYKGFANEKRILRMNEVVENMLVDSHNSCTYSKTIWNKYELLPKLPLFDQ